MCRPLSRPLVHAAASPGVLVPQSELALSGGQAWSALACEGASQGVQRSAPESSSPCPGAAQEGLQAALRPGRSLPPGAALPTGPPAPGLSCHPSPCSLALTLLGTPEGPGGPSGLWQMQGADCPQASSASVRRPRCRARVPPNSSYGSPSPTGADVAAEGVSAPLSPWKLRLSAGAPRTLLRGSEASLPGRRRPPASA